MGNGNVTRGLRVRNNATKCHMGQGEDLKSVSRIYAEVVTFEAV